MIGVSAAGEVVTAATALAGLILVYLGALVTAYGAFQPQERKAVKGRFQTRAWIAFAGFGLALLSAGAGVVGKWLPSECIADAAIILFMIAFLWGLLIAFLTAREIT
jgi:hypothetical protein